MFITAWCSVIGKCTRVLLHDDFATVSSLLHNSSIIIIIIIVIVIVIVIIIIIIIIITIIIFFLISIISGVFNGGRGDQPVMPLGNDLVFKGYPNAICNVQIASCTFSGKPL